MKGARLPKLSELLADPATVWQEMKATWWYGCSAKRLEVATGTGTRKFPLWYHSGMPVVPLRWLLVRDPEGELDPKGFPCTDREASPTDILRWFVRRWYAQKFLRVEVTFEEARAHLGMETQEAPMVRQWSDLAILRATPFLLGLFSLVALMADRLEAKGALRVRQSAWHR